MSSVLPSATRTAKRNHAIYDVEMSSYSDYVAGRRVTIDDYNSPDLVGTLVMWKSQVFEISGRCPTQGIEEWPCVNVRIPRNGAHVSAPSIRNLRLATRYTSDEESD